MALPIDYVAIHKNEVTAEMIADVGSIPTVIRYADNTDTDFSFFEFTGDFPKSLEEADYHKITYIELRSFKAGLLNGTIVHSRNGLNDNTDYHSAIDYIAEGDSLTVEENKQMVVHCEMFMFGDLTIRGTLVLRG